MIAVAPKIRDDGGVSVRRSAILWECYLTGRGSWAAGFALSKCPYEDGSEERVSWIEGWHDCRRDRARQLKARRRLGDYAAWPKRLKDIVP